LTYWNDIESVTIRQVTGRRTGILTGGGLEAIVKLYPLDELTQEGASGMYKKILVPLEGSDDDRVVLDHVGTLAKQIGATVALLWEHRAVESEDPFFRAVQMEEGSNGYLAKQRAESYLPELERSLREKGVDASSEFRIIYAPEADELVAYAEEVGCDLIALLNHRRSSVGRWFFSNIEERVKRRSSLPVLLVPGPKS
jgi:nucleotide-binding universal stress UspA family protein